MKKKNIKRLLGLPLVYLGVVLLAVFYIAGLTKYNLLLFLPPILIICGTIGYVVKAKEQS